MLANPIIKLDKVKREPSSEWNVIKRLAAVKQMTRDVCEISLHKSLPSSSTGWAIKLCVHSVRKVSEINTISCENLMDFNKTRLHEVVLKLHTRAWIFSRLSIASVDGNQLLSEVVFSDLFVFSLLGE